MGVCGLALTFGCERGGDDVVAGDGHGQFDGRTESGAAADDVQLDDATAGIGWRITGGHRKSGTGRLELRLDIDGAPHEFRMAGGEEGVEFELVDSGGDRFGILLGQDAGRPRISEWTDTDRLDIVIEEHGRRRLETYVLNGSARTWQVLPDEDVSPEILAEFRAFMGPTNSLNHNGVGRRLAQFITDPDLPGELERLGLADVDVLSGAQLRIPDWLMATCMALAGCTAIKCPIGGFFNPICEMCAGGTFVCVLAMLSYYW
jgi:hypothetical protein